MAAVAVIVAGVPGVSFTSAEERRRWRRTGAIGEPVNSTPVEVCVTLASVCQELTVAGLLVGDYKGREGNGRPSERANNTEKETGQPSSQAQAECRWKRCKFAAVREFERRLLLLQGDSPTIFTTTCTNLTLFLFYTSTWNKYDNY